MRKRTADFLQGKFSVYPSFKLLANAYQFLTVLDRRTRSGKGRRPVDVPSGFRAKL